MHPETEALLMFAARREHLDKIILPALARGVWVVSDRFADASFAYQGGGRGVAMKKLEILEKWVQQGLQPDLTLLFDVPPAVGKKRLVNNPGLDRIERESEIFFEKVRKAYLQRAKRYPERMHVIDATKSLSVIRKRLEDIIITCCI